MRPSRPSLLEGNYRLSQFSRKMLRCMFRVSDLVEPAYSRAFEYDRVAFHLSHSVSTPFSVFFAALYLTYTFPCQRFTLVITPNDA